jgi:thymidylate kinase
MEQEADEFYEKVRDGYLERAKWQKDRIVVIEGWKSQEEIQSEIWETVLSRFPTLKAAVTKQESPT